MTHYMNFSFEFDDLPDPVTLEEINLYIERMHVEYDSFLSSFVSSKENNGFIKYQNTWSSLEELYDRQLLSYEVDNYLETLPIQEATIVPNPKGGVRKSLSDLRNESVYTDFDDFRVYRGSFPYSGYKDIYKPKRPWIPFRVNWTDDYIIIPIHSTYDRTPMTYDLDILDWKEAGLEHKSRALIRDMVKSKYVSAVAMNQFLSIRDIVRVRKLFDTMVKDRFKRPETLYSWLINNEIKYESINSNLDKPIRTLDNVKKEKAIDCLELAIIVYNICTKCSDIKDSGIGYSVWESNSGHRFVRFFTIFKVDNVYWTLQYLKTRIGYIERHKSNSLVAFLKKENFQLRTGYYNYHQFGGRCKLINQGLLSPIELEAISDNLNEFKTHKQLLNFLMLDKRESL